ncbi:DUF349 domain-containing protein [Pseudoduganella rhizocola]|uniref:DUF349 domain-containing protein n=1 Tax=Pseudoduganella rhizocola TaxID=3382643 RepID=UPI0038B5E8A0
MFEFLRKRPGDPSGTEGEAEQPAAHEAGADAAARRALQVEQAHALAGNEPAALELIFNSEFADVRLAAAEHIQSQEALQAVQQAVRNSDRRVAKLVQGRLDAIRHQQAEQRQAEHTITVAQKMLQDEKLAPNHVADLDRQWKVIAAPPELAAQFGELRAALAARLEAQVALQRQMIDALGQLRRLAPGEGADAEFTRIAEEHAARLASAERASLPRHLLNDFTQALDAAQARLARPAEAPAAAVAEPAPAAEVSAPEPAARPPRERNKASPADKEANQRFMAMVDQMEAALNQGQLHIAADIDKTLKETRTGRLSPQQADRLSHVRAELKRLGDWARWSGNVSREEMVHAVEQLPAQQLPMSELARKVGSMRERWKALDGVSGPAPKSLWEKFDAACTAAYAPAAAHFKHLAEERHGNAARAQALVDEVQALIAANPAAREDWRGIASASQRLRQAWSRLGTIDRKEKKKLDTAFGKAMETLMAPLEEQRKIEVARREQLIEEVGKLNPAERHTVDTLRGLQQSWQTHAKALPLERKSEQALWQKFRAACDAVFAQRKESAHAADHERKAHLHAREAICAGLESASFEGDDKAVQAAIGKALRDAASAWQASGTVPRAAEQRIEQRYKAAVAGLHAQADAIRKRAGAAQANAMRDKLRLTQALEHAIAAPEAIDAQDWAARWQALPALAADYERALRSRFDAALKAAAGEASERAAYAGELEANRSRLLSEVLRLEIVAGIDSGAEFARDRLKMQVEVLQSSLKSGQKPASQATQFQQLCAMPALVDDRTASRIEQLFRRIGASEGK